MVKAFAQFLFLRIIPGWVVALFLVFVSFPWLQSAYAPVAQQLWGLTSTAGNSGIRYQLLENQPAQTLSVVWPGGLARNLSAYNAELSVSDAIDDLPLPRQQVLTFMHGLSVPRDIVTEQSSSGLWRPADNSYKRLVYRTDERTYLDQILVRAHGKTDVQFWQVQSGFYRVPLDPFGGLYLFASEAPEPIQVGQDELFDVQISSDAQLGQQFLRELWALNNQHWSVVTIVSMSAAALMTLLPWLFFDRTRRIYLSVISLVVVNVALLVGFQFQYSWFYPVLLPLLSPFFAWIWYSRSRRMNQIIAGVRARHGDVARLWISHLLDEGKPEAAFRFLKDEQSANLQCAEHWQLVAQGYERNRQFDKSVECYREILAVEPGHATAKQRIKQLKGVVDGSKTVAITQSGGELPVGQVENLSLGRYRILSELGRGAMGIVYEAEDPKIHRKVALKVVHLKSLGVDEVEQVKQRFFREAQAAGKLNHPNIVTVYDVGEEHDVAYIAMDLLIGKPLSAVISAGQTDLKTMVSWIAQAAEALAYAHESDVIHRDVKPANMIIEERTRRLKLTDFGVARIAGVQQTQTGIVLGSPSYMSPEQIRGEKLTGATDIFSLGVTLYQCITGQLPFAGETLPALAYAITQTKQSSPRTLNDDVPVSLVRICNKALQKKPEERFETAADFAKSLNKWVNEHS
ncbi:serine/threonine-protein kinase [Reinekea blandensis]|uniref:non-specific serine/threonine protein kinase n=1 Tax=Reinekea blandensis MED297 TaxID=314283 RepID=A4BHJ9_9GAMM|nr:serine/threonine-protein kinase [Reinekea blandensis]EAR08397.1 Serine/threonine protein kinase [Reinekea blandensis MED297]